MPGELVNLKIAVWSLKKRVKSLEAFIFKQFGNVLNLDDSDQQNLDHISTSASLPKLITQSRVTLKNTNGNSSSADSRRKRKRTSSANLVGKAAASVSESDEKNSKQLSISSFNANAGLVPEPTENNNSSLPNAAIIKEESLVCPENESISVKNLDLDDHLRSIHPSNSDKSVHTAADFNDSFSEINWEFIPTSRGKAFLCVNDFIFKGKKTQDHKCYYYCREQDCVSSVQTWSDELILSTLKEKHTHPNNATEIQDLKIMQVIRQRAIDDPDIPMPVLYREERQRVEETYGSEVAARMPSFSTLYRDRGPKPKPPRTSKPKCTRWAKAKAKSEQVNPSICIPETSVENTPDLCQQ